MHSRRHFLQHCGAGAMSLGMLTLAEQAPALTPPREDEDLLAYASRGGKFDQQRFNQLLGAANEFKEGDAILGIAAADSASRRHARQLLLRTRLGDLAATPPHRDQLLATISAAVDHGVAGTIQDWTVQRLKTFLLTQSEAAIKSVLPGLHSDVIGCVVKVMSNDELVRVGQNLFHPLPGTQIGARGYLGARIQPNSPTDDTEDIQWQVFDAFSYAVGDVLVGTNPVSSTPESVAKVELALQDILVTFGIDHLMPHCVLAHVDVQEEVERTHPGSTALWFQSIAGTDDANATFDISVDGMRRIAGTRTGPFGLYFETGQGADFTNGHGHGFDMVLHESRKYGFARALKQDVARARGGQDAWVHVNDVAGFIGPEVFRTREQLVRCCLEDIVMGKLHGLCLGLDVCSTLHMDVSLTDLDWCLERILPANPAYLMALPTKIDPMLGYLTTAYQDHVRARERFGYRVNDAMWSFFQELGILDATGAPTAHFGDPVYVYQQYCQRKNDPRSAAAIRQAAEDQIAGVRRRGLFIAEGHGPRPSDPVPELASEVQRIYEDGKRSIWAELTPEFIAQIPDHRLLSTTSTDRNDYILHPESGETLSDASTDTLQSMAASSRSTDVQIVISDGLNAHSIMDEGQLLPYLHQLRLQLSRAGLNVAPEHLVFTSGRVRTGYRVGEILFGNAAGHRSVIHVIGERPGSGHHTFSAYLTSIPGNTWGSPGKVDHNVTKVVSGIARTALAPTAGADETARLLLSLA